MWGHLIYGRYSIPCSGQASLKFQRFLNTKKGCKSMVHPFLKTIRIMWIWMYMNPEWSKLTQIQFHRTWLYLGFYQHFIRNLNHLLFCLCSSNNSLCSPNLSHCSPTSPHKGNQITRQRITYSTHCSNHLWMLLRSGILHLAQMCLDHRGRHCLDV